MISSPSPWRVSFDGADGYMWQCLLYFIGLGLAPHPLPLAEEPPSGGVSGTADTSAAVQGQGSGSQQQQERSANFSGWVRRARERKPMLQADNVDLLFRLRGGDLKEDASSDVARQRRRQRSSRTGASLSSAGAVFLHGGGRKGSSPGAGEVGAGPEANNVGRGGEAEAEAGAAGIQDNAFLEFVAPGKVEVRHEELDGEEAVGEGKILVQAICSSISSGTELKVCAQY